MALVLIMRLVAKVNNFPLYNFFSQKLLPKTSEIKYMNMLIQT